MTVENQPPVAADVVTQHPPTVLLIDDQPIIGEAVRRMLAEEEDIQLHYCQDPTQAIGMANQVHPTVILQDLVMPQIDGLTLVRYLRANPSTREVPLIVLSTKEEPTVKAEAFARGANDYLVKLPDKIELIARIRHHSQGYINLLQRNEAYRALKESQEALAAELARAADYVRSLLPAPLTGTVTTAWKHIPSMQLGGDAFGYHWLDDDHLAIYLLDVSGHGVGAALLSVSVMNVLRSESLPGTDFHKPGQVLSALNDSFQMEHHNNMFFTIWYGVYNKAERKLTFSTGGHHAAILLAPSDAGSEGMKRLGTDGPLIGLMTGTDYPNDSCEVEPGSKLYIFCDGVFEIEQGDGEFWTMEEFVEVLGQPSTPGTADVDRILACSREVRGQDIFEDDFSLVEVVF